jgi:hypothetical protein
MTRIGIRTRESKGGGKGRGTVFSTAGGMCWEEESGERGNGERCAGMNPDDYRCRYVRIISASSILVSCKDRALETVASGGGKRDHSHLYERRAYAIHIRNCRRVSRCGATEGRNSGERRSVAQHVLVCTHCKRRRGVDPTRKYQRLLPLCAQDF